MDVARASRGLGRGCWATKGRFRFCKLYKAVPVLVPLESAAVAYYPKEVLSSCDGDIHPTVVVKKS